MKAWEKNVRRVEPYVAGEQPQKTDVIKLNTNENPYPPAPGVQSVINGFGCDVLKKYPDPDITALRTAIAGYHGVDKDMVFVGVGSDDVLSVAFQTFFAGDAPILFPDITYAFYPVWAQIYRIPYKTVPLDAGLRIVKEDYRAENGGIVIANPNAPTSIYEEPDFIEDILKANPGSMVIADEAYIDFGGTSVLPLLERYDNLLVVRTFSKSRSLAGLRIGYCIGCREAIAAMNSIKASVNSYTLNQITIAAGIASVEDDEYFRQTCRKVMQTRERAAKALRELGFSMPESKANFVFARHEKVAGEYIFSQLRQRDIYVRYWNRERISDHLRISIGTDDEMDRLCAALKEIL